MASIGLKHPRIESGGGEGSKTLDLFVMEEQHGFRAGGGMAEQFQKIAPKRRLKRRRINPVNKPVK